MWTAETVLVCALMLLARPADTLPPIHLVDARPSDVSARAEGFVRDGDTRIHLLTSTRAFREARTALTKCGAVHAVRRIASVIAHEDWHLRHPGDEAGAYQAQLMALTMLGSGAGTPLYTDVLRAMREATAGDAATTRRARPPQPPPPARAAADPTARAAATSSSRR